MPDITGRKIDSEITEFSFDDENEIGEILKEAWDDSLRCYLKYSYDLIGFGTQKVEIACEKADDKFAVTVETFGSIESSGSEFGESKRGALSKINDTLEIK